MNGIIILAAGNSSRLGQSKQLLRYRDKTLIRHVADEALDSTVGPVVVVTGADRAAVKAELEDLALHIAVNEEWEEGMASSIRKGLSAILDSHPDIHAVILTVCDQPFVSALLFRELIGKKDESGKRIIACAYAGTLGTPVLFDKNYFARLQNLQGQEGAKKILKQHPEELASVPFDMGQIDIDTYADYEEIHQR